MSKIIGNTTTTPMQNPDWNQSDSTKADYIKNKPQIGQANGIASLDSSGKVPSSQLPSYADDVVEYNSIDDFPDEGESGKIYIDKNTNKTYRWDGSVYVQVGGSGDIATHLQVGVVKPNNDFDVAADGTLSLYKAITLSASVSPYSAEMGSTIDNVTVSWSVNKTPTSLKVDGASVPVTDTSKTLTGQGITTNRNFTVVAADSRTSVTKTPGITFYRYVYSKVGSQTTVPTLASDCVKQASISSFASNGADFTYAVNDYIWLLTTASNAQIQTNVLGQWANVNTTSAGSVTFTQSNGATATYYAYRTDKFTGAGTEKYRIVEVQ